MESLWRTDASKSSGARDWKVCSFEGPSSEMLAKTYPWLARYSAKPNADVPSRKVAGSRIGCSDRCGS